ncbi:MAG: DUF1656 domain-containing protein [Proteobacteria bacterium]|nr:MAG: DUF1656 domain-containing protein [Pseudomonadota bacterium]
MINEINIFGIFFSTLLICLIAGTILSSFIQIFLKKKNLYRFIWHPPLLDLSVTVICVSVVACVLRSINTFLK